MRKNLNLILVGLLISLMIVWLRGGFEAIYLDTDIARDLSELSNIYIGKTVWLGPWLNLGFNTSPIYYYLFFPLIKISGGNARALIIDNMLLASFALGLFGFLALRKWGPLTFLAVSFIGLSSWWQKIAVHPGNGYTYSLWIFLSLTGLFFEIPLFYSALFLGLALADHPGAYVAIPILFYEWWRRKHNPGSLLLIILGLLLPWTPVFIFEFITKGFLIRQFLTHSISPLSLGFSLNTLQIISSLSGLNIYLTAISWLLIYFLAKGRIKIWFILTSICLLLFSFGIQLMPHYLLGIICLMWFIFIIVILENYWGKIILIMGIVTFILFTIIHLPLAVSRSIPQIEAVTTKLLDKDILNKQQKIAVVAALPTGILVPQADDYRFFLRVKGYQVLDVVQYSKADTLIMFIEQPKFDFKNWSTWEIEQFGNKKITNDLMINGIEVAIFHRI